MRHARVDYNRIQDPLNLIGEDEPVFLLRAKDVSAPFVVRFWAAAQAGIPEGNSNTTILAREWADEMEEWQKKNGCKIADIPDEVFEASRKENAS